MSTFSLPRRGVKSRLDLDALYSSKWFTKMGSFLIQTTKAVEGKFNEDPCHVSPAISKITDFLKESVSWASEFPPITQNQRFGNQSFRQWHRKFVQQALPLCKELVKMSQTLPIEV